MTSYILRSIDPVLWSRVKARAGQDGLSLRTLILALLSAYAEGAVSVRAGAPVVKKGSGVHARRTPAGGRE